MMRKSLSRRQFLQMGGVSTVGVVLAACVAPQAGAPAPQAAEGAAGAPSVAPTEVRFATDWVAEARGATIDAALEIWAERYPEKAIVLEPIGGDYFDRLQIQFSGGTVADVILFEGALAADYINEGLLLDLGPTLEALDVDQSRWRPGVVDVFLQDDKIYAIPFQLTPSVWYYNRTLFQEHGIEDPDGTWDWDKVLEVAIELTDAPNSYGFWARADLDHQLPAMVVANSDHHWVNDDATETLIGEPGPAGAVRWLIDTIQTHKVSPELSEVSGLLTAGVTNLFATGKVGMMTGNPRNVGQFLLWVGDRFEWDVMPSPIAPLTGRGGGMWNDQPHVVTSYAAERNVVEESTELVVFLSGDEIQSIIAKDRGATPTVVSIQESDLYLSAPPNSMQTIIDELKVQVGPIFFSRFFEWYTALTKEFELGLIGERSADETIEAMVTEGNKVLASIAR